MTQTLPRAAFDGVEFPYKSRTLTTEARDHTHEFPKQAGGAQEKLGRKVYVISFEVPFHSVFPNYPSLYPSSLNAFQDKADRLTTGPLVVPGVGTIRAYIRKLDRKQEGKTLSGEDVNVSFVEDDLEPFRRTTVPSSAAGVTSAQASYNSELAATRALNPGIVDAGLPAFASPSGLVSPFDLLSQLADDIASVSDQATLYGNLFAAKLAKLTSLIKTVDSTAGFLGTPPAAALVRAMRDLWDAADKLTRDLQSQSQELRTWVVPQTMAVAQIAQSLYGDGARGGELLALNVLSTPFAVRAGTVVRYYAT